MHFVSQSLWIDFTLESCNLWSGMVSPVNARVACCHWHMQTSFWLPALLEPSSTSTYLVRFMPLFQCIVAHFSLPRGYSGYKFSTRRRVIWFWKISVQILMDQANPTSWTSKQWRWNREWPWFWALCEIHKPMTLGPPSICLPSKRGIGKYGKSISQF